MGSTRLSASGRDPIRTAHSASKSIPCLRCGLVRFTPRSFFLVVVYLRLGDDLLLDVAGHDVVVAELHVVRALPLRDAAELGGVTRHLGERDLAADHLQVTR